MKALTEYSGSNCIGSIPDVAEQAASRALEYHMLITLLIRPVGLLLLVISQRSRSTNLT